jgi:outer membrane receptor protein involved in Fe transport
VAKQVAILSRQRIVSHPHQGPAPVCDTATPATLPIFGAAPAAKRLGGHGVVPAIGWRLVWPVCAVGLALPALAQPAAMPTPAAPPTKIEEITVTSQKRSENVRKVPLSITVLSGKQLRAAHIQNFADLTRAVPNLSFSSQAGEGLSNLEMRGISSSAGTATVALYLDDVSLTTRNLPTEGASEPRFLDISRVEVLRGPQSTLYGASALGGTLRYISNPPVMDQFSGNVFSELSGTYHGSVNWDEQGVLNIPLVENQLVLRLAGETGSDSGYINNINPANGSVIKANINSTDFNVGRATLVWTPTDWLTITPSTFFQRFDQRDSDAQYLTLPNDQTPKLVAEPGRDNLIVPALTANADLGFANLIAVTGNYERQFTRTLDSSIYDNLAVYLCNPLDTVITCTDNSGNNVYGAPDGLFKALNNRPSQTFYSNTVRQWSEEVRLVSKPYVPGESALPLTWIAGLYYSDEHTTSTDTEYVNNATQLFNQYGVSTSDPNVLYGTFPGAIGPNNEVYQGLTSYDTAQYAVFGEGTYYPLPNLRLTAGARYQFARDGESTYQNYFYDYGDPGLVTAVSHFYTFLPKFAISYDITPDDTIYANASKGFRLGSENRRITYVPGDANASGTPSYDLAQLGLHENSPSSFGPDKLWNFEIGDKGRLLGGRISYTADFFYILWSDIQTEVPLVTSGDEFQTNAGSATSYGAEFEIRGRVTDDITAGLSGSVVNATLDHGVEVNGNLIAGTAPGEKVPGVPEFNFSADVKKTFIVSDAMTGFVALAPSWVGDSHGDVINSNPDYKRPSYITLDASAGLDVGRWEFTIFGKNLTNNNKIIQRPDIQGSASPEYEFDYLGTQTRNEQGFTLRPLTVGMNAALKF